MFRDFNTGEIYTLNEIKEAFEQFKDEMRYSDFDEYMDYMLMLGSQKVGGFVIEENDTAVKDFVNDLWLDNGNHGFANLIDLETARDDIENFMRDEWELPDGITAESYMDAWNELVNEYAEMEVQ